MVGLSAAIGCGPRDFAFPPAQSGLHLSTDGVDLGATSMDGQAAADVVATNHGDRWLQARITGAPIDSGSLGTAFQLTPAVFSLSPDESIELTLRFSADGLEGDFAHRFELDPDDAAGSLEIWATAQVSSDWDGDGALHPLAGGADCDDTNPDVAPGAPEIWYDGVDADCDGNDSDQDLDGFDAVEAGGDDCDDTDDRVSPGATEVWYDGVDDDCDGNDADQDGDGHAAVEAGGDDCDDADPTTSPSDADPYDGVDNDCDGLIDEDAAPDGLVWFTELMVEPSVAGGQWIELSARDWRTWSLAGWSLRAGAGGSLAEIPLPDLLLAPDGLLVLCEDANVAGSVGVSCDAALPVWPDLGAAGGELAIGPPDHDLDRVTWSASWPWQPAASLVLDGAVLRAATIDPVANDAEDAWCAAPEPWASGDAGSPGAPNSDCPAGAAWGSAED